MLLSSRNLRFSYVLNRWYSRKGNLTCHTLRFYEKEELLPKINRNENGIRMYNEDDLFWIDWSKCTQDIGIQIRDIKYIVDLSQKWDETIQERKIIFKAHRRKLESRIRQLQIYIDKKLDWYEENEKAKKIKKTSWLRVNSK